jgi:serine/threonine protein kinase
VAQSVKPADLGVSIGQVFQGKYRVDAILGHGGMGIVAECTHLALNERVAIKMLRQDVLLDQDAVERFQREARAAAKLKSEYVARVTDVGTFEHGVPYMVMEFLEGHDLGEVLKQRGVLPGPWAVDIVLQTAEALAEAHSLGIVHRDVKPTNLFITWRPDGSALVKVLDFGISKSPMGTDMQLTQTQSLLGTPAYMSPEQMRSARLVDSRSDIWSLGTVFYEILEGRRPFEAESFSEMCVKVAVDPPSPMINTPPGVQQVIMRCLAKAPEQRYSNMAELGRDLVPYAQDPHQANILVERMARMLRRSHLDFSGDTNSGSVPRTTRDVGSAPVRVPQSPWGVGSDPAGAPWHGKSEPLGVAYGQSTPGRGTALRGDPSESAVAVADTLGMPTLRTSRSRWPFVILAFLIAAGVGGAVAFTRGDDDTPPPAPPPAAETTKMPVTPPPAPPPVEVKQAVEAPPVEAPPATDTAAKTDEPKTHGKHPTTTPKTNPKVVKTPPVTKAPETATKPPLMPREQGAPNPEVKSPEVAPCDPLRHPHDCNH